MGDSTPDLRKQNLWGGGVEECVLTIPPCNVTYAKLE